MQQESVSELNKQEIYKRNKAILSVASIDISNLYLVYCAEDLLHLTIRQDRFLELQHIGLVKENEG